MSVHNGEGGQKSVHMAYARSQNIEHTTDLLAFPPPLCPCGLYTAPKELAEIRIKVSTEKFPFFNIPLLYVITSTMQIKKGGNFLKS